MCETDSSLDKFENLLPSYLNSVFIKYLAQFPPISSFEVSDEDLTKSHVELIGTLNIELEGAKRRSSKDNEHKNLLLGKIEGFLFGFSFAPKSFIPLVIDELREIYEQGIDDSLLLEGKRFLPIITDNYQDTGLFDPQRVSFVVSEAYLYLRKEYDWCCEAHNKAINDLMKEEGISYNRAKLILDGVSGNRLIEFGEKPDRGELLRAFENDYFGHPIS